MELVVTNRKGEKFTVLYDECDHELIKSHKWHIDTNGNVGTWIKYDGKWKRKMLHRLIFDLTDPDIVVDHIHHNRLDNRRSELRVCKQYENQRNRRAKKNGGSKFLGVYIARVKNKDGGIKSERFVAGIGINRKYKTIGTFKTEEDAARAYDREAKIYFGEFANLNFKE